MPRRGCTVAAKPLPRRIDGHGPLASPISRAPSADRRWPRLPRPRIALPRCSTPALARGPESIADVAEQVIDAVVNISTSQTVDGARAAAPTPQLPPGSPFEEFFEEFFKNRRGQGDDDQAPNRPPRRVNSLGSGFVIDPSGIVVTNNHVIADADEITVIFNDGTQAQGRGASAATRRPISRCCG